MLDFYTNLDKNIAFGAKDAQSRKQKKEGAELRNSVTDEGVSAEMSNLHQSSDTSDGEQHSLGKSSSTLEFSKLENGDQGETTSPSKTSIHPLDTNPTPKISAVDGNIPVEESSASQPKPDHHKRNQDALAAAKERFLARKRAKEQ